MPLLPKDSTAQATPVKSLLFRLLLLGVVFFGVVLVNGLVNGAAGTVPVLGLFTGFIAAAGIVWFYRFVVRKVEHREADELSLHDVKGPGGKGFALGAGMFAVVVALIAMFGGYSITGWGSFGGMLSIFGLMASVSIAEELLFRGVLFRIVENLLGTWGALVISGALFGTIHLLNPHATLWGAISIAIEAGLMLGAAYAATRTLWMPIGLHFGWNFVQVGVFGGTASGGDHSYASLFQSVSDGPAVLTGGAFGPEASLVTIVICIVPTLFFLRMARRRGHIRPRASQA